MMSKEEVAEILTYCKEKGISYKSRLVELGIPEWKFYEGKSRYAKQQAESPGSNGEFLQLTSGGAFVPMPSFAATTGRGFSKKKDQPQKMMSIELRTPNGTMIRRTVTIEEQIKALMEENEALRRQVSEKDATITSQKETIVSQENEIASQLEKITSQRDEIVSQLDKISSQRAEIARLQDILAYFRKKQFGQMSEKHLPLDPAQLNLFDQQEMTEEEKAALAQDVEKAEDTIGTVWKC